MFIFLVPWWRQKMAAHTWAPRFRRDSVEKLLVATGSWNAAWELRRRGRVPSVPETLPDTHDDLDKRRTTCKRCLVLSTNMAKFRSCLFYISDGLSRYHCDVSLAFYSCDLTRPLSNSGVLCQKQASRAGTSHYILQILWDVIIIPALDTCFWHNTPQLSLRPPWTSYQIRKIVGYAFAGNAGNIFSATDFKGYR